MLDLNGELKWGEDISIHTSSFFKMSVEHEDMMYVRTGKHDQAS